MAAGPDGAKRFPERERNTSSAREEALASGCIPKLKLRNCLEKPRKWRQRSSEFGKNGASKTAVGSRLRLRFGRQRVAPTRNSKSSQSGARAQDSKLAALVTVTLARRRTRRRLPKRIIQFSRSRRFPRAAGKGEPKGNSKRAGDASISERGCLVAIGKIALSRSLCQDGSIARKGDWKNQKNQSTGPVDLAPKKLFQTFFY